MIAAIAFGRRRTSTSELIGAVMNVLLGVVCLMCGLSGALVFVGTTSSLPFIVLGGVLLLLGGVRLWRFAASARKRSQETAEEPPADEE